MNNFIKYPIRRSNPRPKKALITGISGFLGWNMAGWLKNRFALFGNFCRHAVDIEGCQSFPLDLSDGSSVKKMLSELKPEVVFHTAALSHPDQCERAPDEAYRINVEGTQNLLSCLEPSVRFIFLSTDLVFDGQKGWYGEDALPNPLNVYAKTKLEAENRIQAWNGNYAIVRVSLMYGCSRHGVGFLDWLARNLEARHPVSLFTDQYRTCLLVQDAVEALLRLSGASHKGIFHLGGAERINRYEFAKKFASIFDYPLDLLKPVLMRDVPALAVRAADCSLKSERIIQATGIKPRDVESGLKLLKRQLN